jgi:hypothetical protein
MNFHFRFAFSDRKFLALESRVKLTKWSFHYYANFVLNANRRTMCDEIGSAFVKRLEFYARPRRPPSPIVMEIKLCPRFDFS